MYEGMIIKKVEGGINHLVIKDRTGMIRYRFRFDANEYVPEPDDRIQLLSQNGSISFLEREDFETILSGKHGSVVNTKTNLCTILDSIRNGRDLISEVALAV